MIIKDKKSSFMGYDGFDNQYHKYRMKQIEGVLMSEKSFSPAFYYALHALKHMDDAGYTIVPKSPDPKILTHASQKNAVGVDQVRGIYQSIIDVCHLSPGANFTQGNDLNTPDDDES